MVTGMSISETLRPASLRAQGRSTEPERRAPRERPRRQVRRRIADVQGCLLSRFEGRRHGRCRGEEDRWRKHRTRTSAASNAGDEFCLKSTDGPAGRWSRPLAGIAPDFARYLIEFPSGDMDTRPGLGLRSREVAAIAALAALGNAAPELTAPIATGLNGGVLQAEIVEILMRTAVYAGFPAALNGLSAPTKGFPPQAATDDATRAGAAQGWRPRRAA